MSAVTEVYQAWKNLVVGGGAPPVGDGQCVSLIVNNSRAYVEALFPGASWPAIVVPLGPNGGAKDLHCNTPYFTWVPNDAGNPNQLPPQGAVMVFSETPYSGYTNTYPNPYGHTGVCDEADASGYSLLQQNAPDFGQGPNITRYSWKFRHCEGWFVPNLVNSTPAPTPPPSGQLQLQINPGNWPVYTGDGKGSTRLPGAVQGGQKYGPVQIATNGWGIIQFTGKTGHIEPAAFHLF